MMYSIFTSVVFGASLVLANAIPGHTRRNTETIVVADMKYIGPITPGGENYTLVGDAEGIYNQILELNPSYNISDFNIPPLPKNLPLVGRTPTAVHCDVTANYARNDRIRDGIKFLNSLGAGNCYAAAHTCRRPSCSWNNAIYFCNDLGYGMAQRGYDQCHHDDVISAQIFDTGNYNVIISGSNQFGEGRC
ncbi:hypothetical protein V500_09469 [Pseudogymnoascus sp. VKM F-4518 (FW-2643)]|nr:hypothetical protein V500_09469 [Pseudogymnoascus sp. VKM F-4518 (FW-2643)]